MASAGVLPLQTKITQSSSMSKVYATDMIAYDNGYTQRAKKGINNSIETWSVQWQQITSTDLSTLMTAFDGAAGVDYFTWTPPGSTSKKFIVETVASVEPKSGSFYSVTVTLKQDYQI